MCTHVYLVRTANFDLRHNSSILHCLSVKAIQKLVLAFVRSRLVYCTSLLYGCPQYLINRLHKVQNNATCLILKVPETDHITPNLQALHWLPVDARIQYKICSLSSDAINSSGPQYLADPTKDLCIFSPTPLFCWHLYTVHSFNTHKHLGPTCLFTLCTYSLEQPF